MIKDKFDQTVISETDFIKSHENELINIIRDRLGIVIHSHQKKDLYKSMHAACTMFNYTPAEYINLLQHCSPQSPILEQLVAEITVGETYFYRDKRQIEQLKTDILPNLIANKRKKNDLSLRIWSAGCSSGEEIFTIAMMLNELLDDINKWTINLLGTDINTEALKKAIAATYSEWSMRSIPSEIKQKYFTNVNNKYVLLNSIAKMVRFDYINLNDNTYPSIFNTTNSQDLILCRNVFIYFDNSVISEMMNKFYSCLQEGGYLLLGASDPIDRKVIRSDFHYVDNMLFLRETRIVTKPNVVENKKIFNKIILKNAKPITEIKLKIDHLDKNTILNLIENDQWQEILVITEKIDIKNEQAVFYLYARAVALANLGKLESAAELFNNSLHIDPTNKYAHFTYALTLLELNKFSEAEDELRKSIYLDRNFVIGHYQLGLLLLRTQQVLPGLKCLKNAYSIVLTKVANEQVPGSKGLSYGRFSEILEHEISIYSSKQDSTHA